MWLVVITLLEQTAQGRPQSEGIEHPRGDELSARLLDLLIGTIGELDALSKRRGNQFGILLNRDPHRLELRVLITFAAGRGRCTAAPVVNTPLGSLLFCAHRPWTDS